MALIINKELDNGLNVESAYCKINNITVYRENIEVVVAYYINKEARLNNKEALLLSNIFIQNLDVVNPSVNIFKFSYGELKKLNEFKDAIDDLE